jgi:hypothetical protein
LLLPGLPGTGRVTLSSLSAGCRLDLRWMVAVEVALICYELIED